MPDARGARAMYQVFAFDVAAKAAIGAATLLLIRAMPATEYAHYTFALSIATLAQQGVIAAFNRVYIVAGDALGADDGEWVFVGVQLLLFAALGLALLPFRGSFEGAFVPMLALVAAMALSESAKTFYQRDLRFREFSYVEIGRAALFLALVVVITAALRDRLVAGHALMAQAGAMTLAFAVTARRLPLPARRSAARVLPLLREIVAGRFLYLLLYFVALAAFAQIEVWVLKGLTDEATLATFGASFRYYVLLSLALGAVHTVLLPLIQRARQEGTLVEVVRKQQRLLALFVPVVLLGAWLSGWIIPLIDGGRYPGSIAVFRILCLSAIVSFALSPYANVLISDGEFRFMFVGAVLASLLSLLLNMVLVPRYGAIGAALTMLVAYGLFNGGVFLRARTVIRAAAAPAPR